MAGDDIKYTVGVDFTGEGEMKRAAASVANLGRTAAQGTGVAAGAKSAWSGFGVALGAVGVGLLATGKAIGMAYDVLKQGAALQTTQERFDKLSASINTTADSMLGKLRVATQGMIADSDLMASASQIMSLRLADNEDQVVRLATVAGTLGWDMQQVILTFANLSTMRLDALGLSVDEVKNKQKELEAQGYSTAAAFKEAVIIAGEARLNVGGVSDTEKAFLQAEAAVKSFRESMVLSIVTTLDHAGAFTAMSEAAQNLSAFTAFTSQLEGMRASGELTGIEYHKLNFVIRNNGLEAAEAALQAIQLKNAQGQLHAELANVRVVTELVGLSFVHLNQAQIDYIMSTSGVTLAAGTGQAALLNEAAAADRAMLAYAGYATVRGRGERRQARREENLAFVRHDPDFIQAGAITRATMEYEEATAAAYSYGGAVSAVSEEEQKAAEARQRFIAAFNQELLGKPEEGLINAEGAVNVEAMNEALYRQVEAAGASAATLALLGIATGQFSEEQAEAALKAAILQEQINQIADAVIAGKITLEQALGQLGDAQANLNQADLITVAQGVTAIPEGERTVAVEADVTAADKAIGGIQTTLSLMTDAPYLTTLDADIAGLLTGADEAKRVIDSVPSNLTVTINWAQAGVDVLAALRALGIII